MLDLFAGSGAMGIEALSRGAARATFVDQDIAARRAIEANLAACGLTAAAEVVAAPAERFLAGAAGSAGGTWRCSTRPTTTTAGPSCCSTCPPRSPCSSRPEPVDPPFGWEVVRAKRYGRTHVVIAQRIDRLTRSLVQPERAPAVA